jgi:hypothetical protein
MQIQNHAIRERSSYIYIFYFKECFRAHSSLSHNLVDLLACVAARQKQHTKEKFLSLAHSPKAQFSMPRSRQVEYSSAAARIRNAVMVKSGQNAVSAVRSNKSNGNVASRHKSTHKKGVYPAATA